MRAARTVGVMLVAGVLGVSGPAAGAAAEPTTAPITGGTGEPSLVTTSFDLASLGYEKAEYFESRINERLRRLQGDPNGGP